MDAQAMGIEHAAVSIGAINIKWYIVTAQVWSSCSCYFIVYKLALLLLCLAFLALSSILPLAYNLQIVVLNIIFSKSLLSKTSSYFQH